MICKIRRNLKKYIYINQIIYKLSEYNIYYNKFFIKAIGIYIIKLLCFCSYLKS